MKWQCEKDQPSSEIDDVTFDLEFSHFRAPNEDSVQSMSEVPPPSPYIPALIQSSSSSSSVAAATTASKEAAAPPQKETRIYKIRLIEAKVGTLFPDVDPAQIWKTETHFIKLNKAFVYSRFIIQPSYFPSMEHLCEILNKRIKKTTLDQGLTLSNLSPIFSYNIDSDRIKITMGSGRCIIMTDSPYFSKILGFQMEQKKPDRFYVYSIESAEQFGSFVPELDFIKVMFIYSDIIKLQTVADVQAPLLAVLPVRGEDKKQNYWACQPPYYISVVKQEFDSIAIRICTDTGDKFPFDQNGKVICRLHFRRKRLA